MPLQQSTAETVLWSFGPLLRTDGTAATDLSLSDAYTWKIWPGDDQASLATGSGTIRTATGSEAAGFYVDATITTANATTCGVGTFRIVVVKNPGTDDVVVYDDSIKFTSAPGSSAALPTYCTYSDLEARQSWVGTLLDIDDTQAGFAEQRNRARQWLESQIIARVEAIEESQSSRHWPILRVDPIVPTDGVDAGPGWGPSILPDTTIMAQVAVLQGDLDADKLMTGAIDNGQVVDITAWYTLYLIARPQAAGASTDKDWSGWARDCRSSAIRACSSWTALIDTNSDGVPDYKIKPV